MFNQKSVLITGGTGSFGKQFCEWIIKNYKPHKLIIYSRDEHKQSEMMNSDPFRSSNLLQYIIGDVRDLEKLNRSMQNVDVVIHSAALKHVPAAEYNPQEFIKTNILGANNLVEAALNNNVSKVVALSTDKAVNPTNLYGATKLCADKIFIAANQYSPNTKFSIMRYGNVLGSRGSVVPRFINARKTGLIQITHPEMTRFYIKLEDCIQFIVKCLQKMHGGEIFIPKLPSFYLKDLAQAIAPNAQHQIIGLRPGEKMHETLISQDEAFLTLEFQDHYLIQPSLSFWNSRKHNLQASPCTQNFTYSSQNNQNLLNLDQVKNYCSEFTHNLIEEPILC